ncbi:hypothetical protein Q1695_015672 [Nippostrongylus brasiliensis]|nr:hypothetical protein Q1695_015672 [Nippostrongylus brasiliensis]
MDSSNVFDRASSSEGEEVDLVLTKKSRSEVLPVLVWTDEYRFTLINEVMAFPSLWDVEKTSYKDKQGAILLWQKVADSINSNHAQKFSARSVKKQWKNLRDSFYKRHRQMMATTGSSPSRPSGTFQAFQSEESCRELLWNAHKPLPNSTETYLCHSGQCEGNHFVDYGRD